MKPFVGLILVFWLPLGLASFTGGERKWLVTEESRVEISGSSNVNEFQCLNVSYAGNDTLYEERDRTQNVYQLNGAIRLKAERFDCQNKLITNDFRKTLEAHQYPEIKVRFLCLKIPGKAAGWQPVNGQVEITIAGVSRQYAINCQFTYSGKGKARLKGEKRVGLSHFGLQPRPKMLGMIKVDDAVQVNFDLVIQSI